MRFRRILYALIFCLYIVPIESNKKRRQHDVPSDDESHIVPHHSETNAPHKRRPRRIAEPGALGEVHIGGLHEDSEAHSHPHSRLRFSGETTDASTSTLDQAIQDALNGKEPLSPKKVKTKPSLRQLTPPVASHTSYASDEHLPDAQPEVSAEAESGPEPPTSFNTIPLLPYGALPQVEPNNVETFHFPEANAPVAPKAPAQPKQPVIGGSQDFFAALRNTQSQTKTKPKAKTALPLPSHTTYTTGAVIETEESEPPKLGFFAAAARGLHLPLFGGNTAHHDTSHTVHSSANRNPIDTATIVPKGGGGLPSFLTGFGKNEEKSVTAPWNPFAVSNPPVVVTSSSSMDSDSSSVLNVDEPTEISKTRGVGDIDFTRGSTKKKKPAPSVVTIPSAHLGARSPTASVTPIEHSYHRFLDKKVKEALVRNNGVIDIVLLGDSILSHIQRDSKLWGEFQSKYKVMNLGSPGDRTEHLLFRLDVVEMTKAISSSKVIVVMIGTNNVGIGDSVDSVFNGILAVVDKVQNKFVECHIVVMGMLPRASSGLTNSIASINRKLSSKFDGNKMVHFVNLFDKFYEKGRANEKMFMPDHVHPSSDGYTAIIAAITPYLDGQYEVGKGGNVDIGVI